MIHKTDKPALNKSSPIVTIENTSRQETETETSSGGKLPMLL